MRTVILDTNFLLIPHQFRINIMEELERLIEGPHELAVSDAIVHELKGLARGRGKEGVAARVALEGIARKKIKTIKSAETNADRWIAEYCAENPGTIVCTNDIALRRELKAAGARIIVMRTRTRIFWA
ncbi:MAG: PIN domain-containing protein [Candidatus Micrarchaeia archaeon]